MIGQPKELPCSFEQININDFQDSTSITEQEDGLIKVSKSIKQFFTIISLMLYLIQIRMLFCIIRMQVLTRKK